MLNQGLLLWSDDGSRTAGKIVTPLTNFSSDTTGFFEALTMIAFLQWNRALYDRACASVYLVSGKLSTGSDPLNCPSFDPATGLFYCGNELICSYDYAKFSGFVAPRAASNFLSAGQDISMFRSASTDMLAAPQVLSQFGMLAATIHPFFNISRNYGYNIVTAVQPYWFVVGLISKL